MATHEGRGGRQVYDEVRESTRRIEVGLSEFLDKDVLNSLRKWCWDYTEEKANWFEFPKQDFRRACLHAFVRYELMDEVQTFVEGFSDGSFEGCSDIARCFLENNGVDQILKRCERLAFGYK